MSKKCTHNFFVTTDNGFQYVITDELRDLIDKSKNDPSITIRLDSIDLGMGKTAVIELRTEVK